MASHYSVELYHALQIAPGSFALARTDLGARQQLHERLANSVLLRAERLARTVAYRGVDSVDIEVPPYTELSKQFKELKGPIWDAGHTDEANQDPKYTQVDLHLDHRVEHAGRNAAAKLARRGTVVDQAQVEAAAQHSDGADPAERAVADLLEDVGLTMGWQQLPHTHKIAFVYMRMEGWTAKELEHKTSVPAATWRTWLNRALDLLHEDYRRHCE